MEEELLKISELLQEKERKLVEAEALVLQEQREITVLQESKDQLQARFENTAAQIEEFKSGGGADARDEAAVMVDELRDQLTQKQHVCIAKVQGVLAGQHVQGVRGAPAEGSRA